MRNTKVPAIVIIFAIEFIPVHQQYYTTVTLTKLLRHAGKNRLFINGTFYSPFEMENYVYPMQLTQLHRTNVYRCACIVGYIIDRLV